MPEHVHVNVSLSACAFECVSASVCARTLAHVCIDFRMLTTTSASGAVPD